jgi:hypothetical protein
MIVKIVHLLAILFTALTFAPAAAHAFSLMNKIGMNQADYFTAQDAYRRWDLFGWSYLGALVFPLALAWMLRGSGVTFWLAAFGFVGIVAALTVFFIWVLPGNQATQNWTVAPENWQALRTRWEYGHAANAAIIFLSLCALTAAATVARPD